MSRRTTRAFRLVFVLAFVLAPASAGPQGDDPLGLAADQSATLLPDGRWLLLGGEGPTGPVASAALRNVRTGVTTVLSARLGHARAWHTATLLPDGTVLIIGGVDAYGRVVDSVERFDPATERFEPVSASGLTPRAFHTATLLTEGRVLVVGGVGPAGTPLDSAELWDPGSGTTEPLEATLQTARSGHRASLLATGAVLLWGGVGPDGAALENGEVYEPDREGFTAVESVPAPAGGQLLEVVESRPEDGADDVPRDVVIAVRFSRPLGVATVNPTTVVLSGPAGIEEARVTPAEGGMLAFVLPDRRLSPGTTHMLALNGLRDGTGLALPATRLTFTTEAGPVAPSVTPQAATAQATSSSTVSATRVGPPRDDEEEWQPNPTKFPGPWRTGRPDSPWRSLPPLAAPPGVTALAGQVLTLNGQPLADVTLQMAGPSGSAPRTAKTDDTGRFLLTGVTSGHGELLIDGRSASRPGRTYGVFEVGVTIQPGGTNRLDYTIWMPKLDTAHAVTIPSPTTAEVVVTTPRIPGLELRIPPGTVIRDHAGQVVREVSITPVPLDRTPFPLPLGVKVSIYFTIQPGGAYLSGAAGARLVYPNHADEPPGTRFNFWNYDPEERGWYVYGRGTVTTNGRQVAPDPGVVLYQFTGAMVEDTGDAPEPGGPPGDPAGKGGEPVNLVTGLFVLTKTDLVLPDVLPITLTRTYRTRDTRSRAFGVGATHPYDMFLIGDVNPYTYVDLILPDGGRIHYLRISPGTSYYDAEYEHTATPTAFYKSRVKWNPARAWDLTLSDGTVYTFAEGLTPLQSIRDRHGNQLTITRAYGAVGPITRLISPHGRWVEFSYEGDRVTQARDNLGRTVSYTYDASGRLTRVTDANGGHTDYTYDTQSRMLTLTDARGITFLTNEYDAAGKVTRQTQADGSTYQFAYTLDANGKVIQTDETNPRGHLRRVTFNADGYSLTDTRAVGLPEQQTTTYARQTGTNLVLSVTDALGRQTAYTYDAMGKPTNVTRLAGTGGAVTTSYTYGPIFHQVASVTDPLSHATTLAYDSQGNPITITNPLGQPTTFTYNAAGQPLTVVDPLGNTTRFEYDQGDLVAVIDPLNNRTSRFVDSAGRLTNVTSPLGLLTRYAYDPLNRLTQLTDPLGGLTQFGYDPNGNLLSVTDARSNATTYTYDAMDRLASRTDPLLRADSYAYDLGGNPTTFTDRKSQVTGSTYDAAGRRTSLTLPNGVVTEYSYDAAFRVTGLTYRQGTTTLGTLTYAYDAAGNRTAVGGTWARTGLPQALASATYDAANQQLAFGASTLSYDANGSLTSLIDASGPTTYTWDARNRLAALAGPGLTASFQYDPVGRRARRVVNGTPTDFLYDGLNPVQELASGSVVANLLTGLGIDEYFTRTDTAGLRALLADGLGSTIAVTDASTAVQTQYTYEPFGAVTTTGSPNGNPLQFTGRENDGTGLHYYRTRYYHPGLARFISEDPIGFRGGVNIYAYVGNNPLRYTDPLGLDKKAPGGGQPPPLFAGFGGPPGAPTGAGGSPPMTAPPGLPPIIFFGVATAEAGEGGGMNEGDLMALKLATEGAHNIDTGQTFLTLGGLGIVAGIITDNPFLVLGGGIAVIYGGYEFILGKVQYGLAQQLIVPAR